MRAGKLHSIRLAVGEAMVRAYRHGPNAAFVAVDWAAVVSVEGGSATSCNFSLPAMPPHQARSLAAALLASADEAGKMDDDIPVGEPQ